MALPAFKQIGYAFKVGKQSFAGVVIASPFQMYLVQSQARTASLAMGGGLLAAMIDSALARRAKKTTIETRHLEAIDPAVLEHEDWPIYVTTSNASTDVLIISRDAVEMITHPSFTNLLQFTIEETPISIEYGVFRGAKLRDYLVETGWQVKWKGTVLSPGRTA